jgi:3-methyladenine DNA glycosylase/8-oxoguanine DNA glycosylase
MRALGEPDAFPSSDLGLLRALALNSSRDLERRAEAWRPWRAYAAMYLWRMLSHSDPRKPVSRKAQERAVARNDSFQNVSVVV